MEPEAFAPVPAAGKRGLLKGLVRVVVGGGVFAILLATTDLGDLVHELSRARPGYIAAAGIVFFVGLAVSALRWREYLIALQIPMSAGTIFRLYFVGTFFNAFLPTGIGGDAYKAIRIGRGRAPGVLRNAFASVFLDRFAGVVGLAVLGLVMSLSQLATGGSAKRVPGLGAVLSAGILLAAALVLGPGERLLGKGRLIKMEEGIGGRIRRMVRAVHTAGRERRAFALGLALGFGFQITVLTFHWVVTRALDISVPLPVLSGIVVISSMAVLIPLSVGGLGFLELSYRWTLGQYGVNAHRAIAFALLVRAVLIVTSAIGGLVYLIKGGEVSASEAGVGSSTPPAPEGVG